SAIIDDDIPNQGDVVKLAFQQDQTRLYCDGWLASEI
ncbi:MAG: ABC transporter ATP-binding protein, partial [Candidatus Puniceispirillum sp.]|nr:ABC transporter ATP-binding protein [Candidatus Puniceispirillum sp.]